MTLLLLFQPAGGVPPGGATGTAFESFVGGGMYLGRWEIDDYLTFAAQTHDSTGAAADADAVPSYAIYEDETAAALVTGNMAQLGAVTGFYTERVQLTAAAGFELGKCYAIRVSATVGGVAAAKADMFQVEGDAYAVVSHADYGNAKLVRSTTPANTLTVDASHQALSLTNAVTNDAITAAAIANGAIDAATFAAGAIDAAAIADGAIDAATFAAGALTAAAIATNAIDADALAADGLAEIADAVWDEALAGHAGAGTAGAALSAATAPTAADVADAVWDEAIAGHLGAGTTGAALNAAGAAGDPWTTALPGAYADGTAGDIIGNLVDDIGDIAPAVAVSSTTAASVSSGALAIRTHHSLSQAISSTYSGDLSAATKLWLAVKAEKDDTDAQSVIFIEKTAGLTVLAGAAYTTVAHGSLTVGGLAGAWTVTVGIDEVATGLLTAYADGMLWAECKALVAGSTVAVWDGVCDVARGIVNAVS